MMSADTRTTVQVHRVFIKATPQAVWDAITQPDWIERYGYKARAEYGELKKGGAYRAFATKEMRDFGGPEVIIDGEVLECDPPNRLVQTWHAYFSPEMAAEPPTTLTWEIEELNGMTCLTVIHDVTGAPITASITSGEQREAGGGWSMVISDLKSILENGKSMSD